MPKPSGNEAGNGLETGLLYIYTLVLLKLYFLF